MTENPDVPTDFSDFSHYVLYEGRDEADDNGIPVYQSKSTGMLFAEDATPLIYLKDRLLETEKLVRGLIEVSGWTEQLERIANDCVVNKEAFAKVLEKTPDAAKAALSDWKTN